MPGRLAVRLLAGDEVAQDLRARQSIDSEARISDDTSALSLGVGKTAAARVRGWFAGKSAVMLGRRSSAKR
jgi:hypothetical protein